MKKLLVEVCVGTHCTMLGATHIMDAVNSLDEIRCGQEDSGCQVEVVPLPCMNLCKDAVKGPFVRVGDELIAPAQSDDVMAAIMRWCSQKEADCT